MLPAVDGNCNACDTLCLRKIEHGARDIVRPRAALKRQALRLRGELYIGLTRAWQSWPWRDRVDPELGCQCLRQRGGGGISALLLKV